MKLSQWIKYLARRDTTFAGEFAAMQRLAGADCPRYFVDVGANDGFYASNSFPFAARGWQCLLVEPHPEAFARLQQRHRKHPHVRCHAVACGTEPGRLRLWTGANRDTTHATFAPEVHAAAVPDWAADSIEVPVVRLDQLLREAGFPTRLGILSVDTEGWEVEVLRGMDLSIWRPRLIVTEDTDRGLAEKRTLLAEQGYQQRLTLGVNSFWTSDR
ncbi:MAG: FkbM family methyltransferase [Verrucomicrobiales bacterium]|nr:FkbM family methyltransferase [Verrucomicrobiales bacterium]